MRHLLFKLLFFQYKFVYLFALNFRNDLRSVKFIFHHGPNFRDSQRYDLNDTDKILTHPKFDKSRNTIMYMHGYTEGSEVQSVHITIESYLKRGEHNIILLEWSELAAGNYFVDAVPNANFVATIAADRLIKMFRKGLDLNKFHLLGHSVGGQAIGKIGRDIIALSRGKLKLPRITSLDPAFPKYYRDLRIDPISYRDAEFVDIIHTDSWLYGSPLSAGTVDFWPNGGKSLQPGCPRRKYKQLTENDLCSHRRSWLYWSESVLNKNPENFLSVKAKSWNDFKIGNTEPLERYSVMGYYCPRNLTGNYYLQTNEASPYARDERGTKYVKVKPKQRNWH